MTCKEVLRIHYASPTRAHHVVGCLALAAVLHVVHKDADGIIAQRVQLRLIGVGPKAVLGAPPGPQQLGTIKRLC